MFSNHALTQSVKEAMQIKNYWIYHRVDKKKNFAIIGTHSVYTMWQNCCSRNPADDF